MMTADAHRYIDETSCTPPPPPPLNNNVLFVSRIADDCTEDRLRASVLSTFGTITSVKLCNQDKSRGSSAYAFVTYQSATEVIAAVEAMPSGGSLFRGSIKIADPPRSKAKFDALEERNAQRWNEVCRVLSEHKPNVVLNVNASHCDRIVDYLSTSRNDRSSINYQHANKLSSVHVLPCEGSTNHKLVLLSFRGNPEMLVREISEKTFLTTALNRCFVVEQGISVATTKAEDVSQKVVELLVERRAGGHTKSSAKEEEQQTASTRLRVQSFPSKLQQVVADGIEKTNDSALEGVVTLDPVDFDTILSVVRVYIDEAPPSKSKRCNVDRRGLYLLGLSDSSTFYGNLNARSRKRRHEGSTSDHDQRDEEKESPEICRAYHKLEEAFFRYEPDPARVMTSSVALDVGAAPGGWTKYLAESVVGCQKVFSIDPANLSPVVLENEKVVHIPRQIQDALPDMEKDVVGIYVSDMCLSVMEKQLEYMLMAKKKGVLKSGCFFVLTLKCILGHAKEAHDEQAQVVARRLSDGDLADEVAIIHLFNNRAGERTLLGYLR
jgi:RNA recognition motif-containing protein